MSKYKKRDAEESLLTVVNLFPSLVIVVWLFLAVQRVSLQFVIIPDHTHYFLNGTVYIKFDS